MTEFLNPYQFIPTTGKVNKQNTTTTAYRDLPSSQIRHDYWDKDSYSGRIVCEIELLTPTVVGGQQTSGTEHQVGTVTPYLSGQAIPANSLRGMVSSLAEALSQSALRVLNQSTYSVRKEVGTGLSAIGQLKKTKEGYSLRPLCLPTIVLPGTKNIPEQWQKLFGANNNIYHWLPAYINGYSHNQTKVYKTRDSFLATENPNCFHAKRLKFYYAKLHGGEQSIATAISLTPALNLKNGKFLIGQTLKFNEPKPIISQQAYDQLPDPEKNQYTRGILHILGIEGHESEIPHTKKHEKFIPIPPTNSYGDKERPIPQQVLDNFIAISQQCAEDSKGQRPFLPKGYREHKTDKDYWQPAHGELVYFDIDSQGTITEISYSAIWRKKIDGDSYQAFTQINPNLLPWGNALRKPDQTDVGLTPAEALFGVVPEAKTDTLLKSYNLASRLRFADAESLTFIRLMPEQTLKILASPKPPAPCLYFKNPKGSYIAKKDLKLSQHQPNGRKVYIHHPADSIREQLWQSRHPQEHCKQKLSCQPMPAGSHLYFHIDFTNLSWDELSLLVIALKPDADYSHRLGLGKPLGLGSVMLTVCGLFFNNRQQRYQTLDTPRYTAVYQNPQWPGNSALTQRYPLEQQALENPNTEHINTAFSHQLIDSETLKSVCTVGNRVQQTKPVSYPYADKQIPQGEQDGFEWFVNNQQQSLRAINQGNLPTLKTN